MTKAIAAIALCSFASLAFAGTEVSRRKYRDETARAEYSWIENCTSKQLTVAASKTKLKEDGVTADTGPSFSITYATYTFCDPSTAEQTFWTGTSSNADLQIDSNLRSARLLANSVTLKGSMYRGTQFTDLGTTTVAVDINWSSDDPIDKYRGTFVTRYPGYHEVNHVNGIYRLSTATGLISDGVRNWFPTVPESAFVQLYRLKESQTILIKE